MDLLRRRSPYSYTGSQCPTVADPVIGLINPPFRGRNAPHRRCSLWPILLRLIIQSNRSSNANKVFRTDIFSLFSPSQNDGEKRKKKYHSLVKEPFPPKAGLSYHLLSLRGYYILPPSVRHLFSTSSSPKEKLKTKNERQHHFP